MQVQEYSPPVIMAPEMGTPPTPTVPREREPQPTSGPPSPLGQIIVFLAVLALGVLGTIDLAGAAVAISAYLALPLAVIGLGLIVGAWYGRARWLIALGVLLSIALLIASVTERVVTNGRSVTWRPTSIEQLDHTYTIDMGSALLDLSAVDFTGRSETIEVHVDVGDLTVILPSTVDTRVEVSVDVGNAGVFGTTWGGIGSSERTVTDDGVDGAGGGGELVLRATVDVGDLEVRR